MKAVTVPPPLPPALLDEGRRDHLRKTSLMMRIPEGRASYLTLGALLSPANNKGDRDGDG